MGMGATVFSQIPTFCVHLEGRALRREFSGEPVTLGDHIRRRRLELGLEQRELARQLGADDMTVCNWEKGRTFPSIRFLPRIVRFLGYVPFRLDSLSVGERLRLTRMLRGLSQRELARRLSVDPSTVRRWEAGKRVPARHYMVSIDEILKLPF